MANPKMSAQHTLVNVDRLSALAVATRRLHSLPEIEKSRARTDPEALDTCLASAVALVTEHAAPRGLYLPVIAQREDGLLRLGPAEVQNEALFRQVRTGERVLLYLVSNGYTSMSMFEAVEKDYVAYHFQHFMSLQLLFTSANLFHEEVERREGKTFRRFPVLNGRPRDFTMEEDERGAAPSLWDAQSVAGLFRAFEPNALGVEITQVGDLNPIYSLMGVKVERK